MVTFQRSLEAREQKKVRWSQVWTVGRLGDGGDACLGQIIGDNEGNLSTLTSVFVVEGRPERASS